MTVGQTIMDEQLEAARDRRKKPTPSEKLAWEIVRNRGLLGLKFRREQPLDGFWVDLYCARLRISIEIDGGVHDDPALAEYDKERSRMIEARAIRLLRIPADKVSRESLEALVRPILDTKRTTSTRVRRMIIRTKSD